ncbi:MAG: hypothetical protein LBO03_08085 [Acidaminococcales bacterium]|jgi:GNAT superfamily N-acetyltransferase|nr:hypothetical protein [Acidaminococcales bacterium]
MEIIDAVWEKRNLGVVAKEINLAANDTLSDLEQLRGLDCEYAVARVPAGAIELMFQLEDMGYRYIETMFAVRHDLKNIGATLDRITKRFADSISYRRMADADLAELKRQLKLGVFHTDRVYVDPHFTKEQSAQRYMGWIADALENGYEPYKCMFKGKAVGFFVSRLKKDGNHGLFIGVYKEFEAAGFGTSVLAAQLRHAAEAGAKTLCGAVSSNNMSSLRMNLYLGGQITSARYVYVKHG